LVEVTNDNTNPVMYYGYVDAELQPFASVTSPIPSVAREGEMFVVRLVLRPAKLGVFYLPLIIATNCSPPYLFEAWGETVPAEFGFFNQGEPVEHFAITNVSSAIVVAGLHISNFGKSAIPIDGIFVRPASRFVTLNYTCPSTLSPNESCFVRMNMSARDFRRSTEVFELVFRSIAIEKSVRVSVTLNAFVLLSLKIREWLSFGIVVWSMVANIILTTYNRIRPSIACIRDYQRRKLALFDEIDRLTMSKYSSVGIQVNVPARATEGNWRPGKWIRTSAAVLPPSKDGIGFLTQFLRELG
jgi:hypothetical protein